MKRRLGSERISPLAGFEPATREPKSGALTARPRGRFWPYYRVLHVLKSSRAFCPCVSSFFSIVITLGKRELVCVLLEYLFVCFVRDSFVFFLFFFVSGVFCGL